MSENIQASQTTQVGTVPSQPVQGLAQMAEKLQTPEPATPAAGVEAAPKPAEPKVGSQFASIARKEKEVVAKQQALKAERAQIEAEKAAIAKEREEYQKIQALKKENPIKALEALGYTYEQATQFVMNDMKPTPELEVKALKEEFTSYTRRQEEEKKAAIEKQRQELAQQNTEALKQIQEDIDNLVTSNKDKYEFSDLNKLTPLVIAIHQEHFEKHKRTLTHEQALDIAETYIEKELEKNVSTKKGQEVLKRLGFVKAPEVPATPQVPQRQNTMPQKGQPTRTLSNQLTPATAPKIPARTEKERMERALAKWNELTRSTAG